LRSESKHEVDYVKEISQQLGCNFVALDLDMPTIYGDEISNTQERARDGRYDLMTEKCKELDIYTLLTGHHKDDYIENYIIRKNRESSILGLSSNYRFFYKNVRILRPLFSFYKHELIDFLKAEGVNWYEDKSNDSVLYTRNKIRYDLSHSEERETQHYEEQLSSVNENVGLAEQELIENFAESTSINNFGEAQIDLDIFSLMSKEIQYSLLAYVITLISGKDKLPRRRSLVKILAMNEATYTLHGCNIFIASKDKKIVVTRETSNISVDMLQMEKEDFIWDNRFRILSAKSFAWQNLIVARLTRQNFNSIKKLLLPKHLEKIASLSQKNTLFTLPVLLGLEKVIAIPHISYYDETVCEGLEVVFSPSFTSRFFHYFSM
jgi:tRNA(Ile)-lysidine synthase